MAKKANTKKTNIVMILDKSGSMTSIWDSALTGVDEVFRQIKDNVKNTGDTRFSFVIFSSGVEVLLENVPVELIDDMKDLNIRPDYSTALYDAIKVGVETIVDEDETDDTGYLVTVITDGYNNASQTTQAEISSLIKELEDTGKWTFNFMMSNVDIHTFMASHGLRYAGNVSSFAHNTIGTADAFGVLTKSYEAYANTRGVGETATTNAHNK